MLWNGETSRDGVGRVWQPMCHGEVVRGRCWGGGPCVEGEGGGCGETGVVRWSGPGDLGW